MTPTHTLASTLALAALLALAGCPSEDSEDPQDDDSGGSDDDDATAGDDDDDVSGDDDDAAAESSFGSGSNFDSVDGMLAYVNEQRAGYWSHERWKGWPFFGGEYHTNYTWPDAFIWDGGLAAQAQAEADRVASGGAPTGDETDGNPGVAHLFIDGLYGAPYMVGGPEEANIWESQESALGRENGFMRMAVYYHDYGGDGPVLTKIGIGASDAGGGDTWWVMVFE
jgi:hypothetical protein